MSHFNLDIQAAMDQSAGVGRYVKNLAESLEVLCSIPPAQKISFSYFAYGSQQCQFLNKNNLRESRLPKKILKKFFFNVGFPNYDQVFGPASVFHFPDYVLYPVRSGKRIVTIHDLSFLLFPETLEPRNLAFLSKQIPKSIQEADLILTISNTIAQELKKHFAVPSEKIKSIHLGVDKLKEIGEFSREQFSKNLKEKFYLGDEFILSVSTLEPRKNLDFLISVFEELRDFRGQLVLVGKRGWKDEKILKRIADSKFKDRICYLEKVTDQELSQLYRLAKVFVSTSLYEGFGFSPLEAMAHRCPVISSTGGSLKEVLARGAVLVADFNITLWAEILQNTLKDSQKLKELSEEGYQNAQRFTWSKTAEQTFAAYRALISSK